MCINFQADIRHKQDEKKEPGKQKKEEKLSKKDSKVHEKEESQSRRSQKIPEFQNATRKTEKGIVSRKFYNSDFEKV